MARKGENIYQRKNGRWEGKYKRGMEDGKIRYGYVSGSSYKEVLWKKKEAEKAYEKGKEFKSPGTKKILFKSVSEEWLKEQESLLKESSFVKYRGIIYNYLLPEFGEELVMEITREEVLEYMKKMLLSGGAEGGGLSPKTVTGTLSVLKTILEYARDYKNIAIADLNGLSVKQPRKPLRILSVNEQRILEEFLVENMNPAFFGILLCLYTGIRLGELCALKWEDISFEDKTLHIHGTMARIPEKEDKMRRTKVSVTTPKSNTSVRYIPIPKKMLMLAKEMEGPQNAYILTGSPKRFMEPRNMEYRFHTTVKKIGISGVNFHVLRHTFATRCIELGFDAKSLSEILGHASVRITMDRYVHPTMETKQKNMDRLSSLMCGI